VHTKVSSEAGNCESGPRLAAQEDSSGKTAFLFTRTPSCSSSVSSSSLISAASTATPLSSASPKRRSRQLLLPPALAPHEMYGAFADGDDVAQRPLRDPSPFDVVKSDDDAPSAASADSFEGGREMFWGGEPNPVRRTASVLNRSSEARPSRTVRLQSSVDSFGDFEWAPSPVSFVADSSREARKEYNKSVGALFVRAYSMP